MNSILLGEQQLKPLRALRHPMWLGAVLTLALNDHVLKGSGLLPGWMTGKLSDIAGLFAAPALLAALCGVKRVRGLLAAHAATGLVFGGIKASAVASGYFVGALAMAGLPWKNVVDPTDLVALLALPVAFLVLLPSMRADAARVGWGPVLLGLPVMLASGNEGGANEGGKAPGNGDQGIDLSVGEIAVDPQGRYFVSQIDGHLMVADLSNKRFRQIQGMPAPSRLAFWPAAHGQGFFLVSLGSTSEQVISYDLAQNKEQWRRTLTRLDDGLQVNEAGSRVVLWQAGGLVVLNADNGSEVGAVSVTPSTMLVDVDLDKDRLITTTRGKADSDGLPTAQIRVLASADMKDLCPTITVPNCADELVIGNNGKRAFLAPTFCGRDPVSVIDLESCQFEKNLPGFGPVALSENGRTAVAFLDRDNTDPEAPPVPEEVKKSKEQYHLMFIDTATLEFGTTPVGDLLPRYAVTPDGQLLLVDAMMQDSSSNVRIVDVTTRALKQVQGPSIRLENYVLLPDSSAAFALHKDALYELNISAATTQILPLTYTPVNINRTPLGDQLLLRDSKKTVHLFDIASRSEAGTFSVE